MGQFPISRLLRWLLGLFGLGRAKGKISVVLDCEEVIFRLALNAKCAMPNTTEAFLLRKSDNGKLSVYRINKTSFEDCSAKYNRPKGAFTLHVGRVRTLQSKNRYLEVIEDESDTDKCPGHASILNLPDPQNEEEAEQAERIATLLRRQSRQLIPIKLSEKR